MSTTVEKPAAGSFWSAIFAPIGEALGRAGAGLAELLPGIVALKTGMLDSPVFQAQLRGQQTQATPLPAQGVPNWVWGLGAVVVLALTGAVIWRAMK